MEGEAGVGSGCEDDGVVSRAGSGATEAAAATVPPSGKD